MAALSIVYALTWWFALIGGASNAVVYGLAIMALIIEPLVALALDWGGFTSLVGLVKWRQMSGGKRFWLFCAFFFLPEIMLGIYLVRAIRAHNRSMGRSLWQQGQASWRRLRGASRGVQLAVGAGALVAIIMLCSATGIAANTGTPPFPTDTPGTAQGSGSQAQFNTPTDTPLPQSTATPTAQATNTARPTPTNTPKPCPTPCNPWGYNFTPGNLIYNPPSGFCSYFACIANFPNGNGYVEECQDAMYSKSGGIQGSCSHHGGNWRPLYSH